MRTKYLISLKLLLQVLELVCSIARLKNKIREETKKVRDVVLLQPAAVIFAFLVLPRFFSFPFSFFVSNLKTIFHSPFYAYCAWAQEQRENVMRSEQKETKARRLKARRKSYKAVYVNLGNHGLTLLSYSAYHCLACT